LVARQNWAWCFCNWLWTLPFNSIARSTNFPLPMFSLIWLDSHYKKYINFIRIQRKQRVIVTCWSCRSRRLLVTWHQGDIDVWNKIYVSGPSRLASLRRVHRKLMRWRPWQLDGRLLRVPGDAWRSAGDVSSPWVCVSRGDKLCCSKLAAIRNRCDTAAELRWRGII